MFFPFTYEHSSYIDAPPHAVWRLANDIARYPEWVEATLEILEADPVAAPGAVYVERSRIAGPLVMRTRWTVAEFNDQRMVQRHVCDHLPGLWNLWGQLRVEPDGPGACFKLAFGATVVMGPVSRPLGVWLRRTFVASTTKSVQQFRGLAEVLAAEPTSQ
jgi:hypothetical protein